LIKPQYKYNFRKRTILYIFVGFFCVSLDYFSFILFSKFIDPAYANPIGYGIGSIFSFLLNKQYTFKSKNSKLSLFRYLFIILIGFSASQLVVILGLRILRTSNNLGLLKAISILIAVGFQYLCNTLFGSSRSRSNEFEKKKI